MSQNSKKITPYFLTNFNIWKLSQNAAKNIKKPTWIFLEIFKGFFRLKITRKLLVLIKNGEKVTHIFFFIKIQHTTASQENQEIIQNTRKN